MKVELLRAKLHHARITHVSPDYPGSLGIDVELMELVELYPYEKVLVGIVENGNRFETYAIPEPFGSRRVVLKGAAAQLGAVGQRIIIMSFCWVEAGYAREGRHRPRVVSLDQRNEPVLRVPLAATSDETASMLDG